MKLDWLPWHRCAFTKLESRWPWQLSHPIFAAAKAFFPMCTIINSARYEALLSRKSSWPVDHLIKALSHLKPVQLHDSEGMPLLTRREEDVVRLVADGMKNREIAQRLRVKEHSGLVPIFET